MNIQIIKSPSGRFNLYCSDIQMWVAENLSEAEVRDWFAIAGAAKANDILEQLERGERPYGTQTLTFEEAEVTIELCKGIVSNSKSSPIDN